MPIRRHPFLDHRGTLTPDTIKIGMHVRVHYALRPDSDTGIVRSIADPWADIELDGYEGLVVPLLIAEMEPLDEGASRQQRFDELNGQVSSGRQPHRGV